MAPKENYHLESHSKGFGVLEEFHEIKKIQPSIKPKRLGRRLGGQKRRQEHCTYTQDM